MHWFLTILLIISVSISYGQISPSNDVVKERLAKSRRLLESGLFENSIGELDEILAHDRTNYEALRLRAMAYHNLERFEPALIDYHTLVRLNPDNLDANFGLAVVEFHLKQFGQSIIHFKRLLDLEEKETETVYFQLNRDGFIDGVNSINTLSAEVYNYLGLAYQEMKDCRQSFDSFQKAFDKQEKVSYLMNLGNAYEACLQDSMARQTYEKILHMYPGNSEAGLALLKFADSSDLLAGYDEIIAVNEESYSAYVHRGMLLMERENFHSAIVDFEKASQLDSTEIESWFNLGLCYATIGEQTLARRSLLKVIENNPRFYKAYAALGNIAIKTREFEDAIKWYTRALNINRTGYLFYNRAVAYHQLGMYELACSDWWRALQLKFVPPEPVEFCEEDSH